VAINLFKALKVTGNNETNSKSAKQKACIVGLQRL